MIYITEQGQADKRDDSSQHQLQQQQQQQQQQNQFITDTDHKEQEAQKLLDIFIDDVIFCECLQVHRAAKMGMIFIEPGDETYKIKDGSGLDVFGQPLVGEPLKKKKPLNCTCPQCNRNIAASKMAHHLEKCMGMGRLSARAASNKRVDTSSSQM